MSCSRLISGLAYSDSEAEAAAKQWLVRTQTFNGADQSICRETAEALTQGKVVGWFQGRSEFGPRALGNRSILADPRDAKMKDLLNARVKHRQAFRPFAPIVLAERSSEIFEGKEESPFMLLAKSVVRNGETRFRPLFMLMVRQGYKPYGASTTSGSFFCSRNSKISPAYRSC